MRSVVCSLTKINHCAWAEQAQGSKDEPTKEELLSRAEAAFTGGQRADRPSGLRRNHHRNNRGARKLDVGDLCRMLTRFSAAVATSREGHRSPRSGREGKACWRGGQHALRSRILDVDQTNF
jgi:hypothetical protein